MKTVNNMDDLVSLNVIKNSSLGLTGYDDEGKQINNLDLLKQANSKKLKTVNLSETGITAEEIKDSKIRDLSWTSFTP